MTGSGNVCIGRYSGLVGGGSASNQLFVSNDEAAIPLIWGDFSITTGYRQLRMDAKTGIGLGSTAFPSAVGSVNVTGYRLFVRGGILADEVRVRTTWADYVFRDDYELPSLQEVEDYINTNGHLKNVPSANQVEEEGIEVGQIAKIQQQKIEELTLYLIQQNKEIETLKAQVLLLLERK